MKFVSLRFAILLSQSVETISETSDPLFINQRTLRLASKISKRSKNKERRARLTIVNPALPALAEMLPSTLPALVEVIPTSQPTLVKTTSVVFPVAIDSSLTLVSETAIDSQQRISFNPCYDRKTPTLSDAFSRQTVLDVTQALMRYR